MFILSHFITFTSSISTSQSPELHHPKLRKLQKHKSRIAKCFNIRLRQLITQKMLQSHKWWNYTLRQFYYTIMYHFIFGVQQHRYYTSSFKLKLCQDISVSPIKNSPNHTSTLRHFKSCTYENFQMMLFTTFSYIHWL